MKLVDNVDKININDNNKYHLEDTVNNYINYIKLIENFDEKLLKHYLETIKYHEILNNQHVEKEDSFLISLYNNMYRQNSLDTIIKITNEKRDLTKEDLKSLHKILMRGTKSEIGAEKFRSTDTKFVGTFNADGTKNIDYIPIPSNEINETVDKAMYFLNNNKMSEPFMTPIIFHALISVMQPFDDGNTRLSRLVQHAEFWKNTNELYSKSFTKPLLYLSKNYLLTRGDYRGRIAFLAKEETNEAWNRWIQYNLNMLDEQLYYLNNNVMKLVK
ncbi:MAG: Fic family protein [Bacilli bacterium]|nr:Fic family protein [Bacilli bacterium]